MTQELLILFISLGACILLLLVFNIIALVRINGLEKRVNQFFTTGTEKDLEAMLNQCLKENSAVLNRQEAIQASIADLNRRMALCIQKTGLVRYNPFDNVGGELCFALSLLDEKNNGVVVNAIFSREGSYTYAKPVKNGESSYTLSEEEKQSLALAIKG